MQNINHSRGIAVATGACCIWSERCRNNPARSAEFPKPAKPEPNRFLNALRPRPYGLFLDDLPIHIRPDLPAARVQT